MTGRSSGSCIASECNLGQLRGVTSSKCPESLHRTMLGARGAWQEAGGGAAVQWPRITQVPHRPGCPGSLAGRLGGS
jgi:hypothetical protein